MKYFLLNIVSFVAAATLLIIGGNAAWKRDQKGIALITFFVAFLMLWQAYENIMSQQLTNKSLINTSAVDTNG